MLKKMYLAVMAALVLSPAFAQEALKREMRTVWVATVSNIDWPSTKGTSATTIAAQKKQLTDLLDGFVATNMNSVCLQVRPMADALYKSSYEPWSSYVSGTRGKDPGWDPLAFAVEECHKRGLELNAWINPYRFSNSSGNDCTTALDEAVKNSGILLQGKESKRLVFNPGLEASRQHLLKVCKEIITNYEIDGIIFDDYFYPGGGMAEDSSAGDYQLWKDSGTSMTIGDWRRANVNLMVKEMWNMVQATKPYVKFSIGPAGVAGAKNVPSAANHGVTACPVASDWQYNTIYSDPLAWFDEHTIDYMSPQLYWQTTHSTNPFGELSKWWAYVSDHFGRHDYPSLNIYYMASTNSQSDWEEIAKQINFTRQYDADGNSGVNFYSAKYLNGPTCTGLGSYLAQNVFTTKALPPALTWHSATHYDAPAGLAYASGKLSWTSVGKSLVRYSVYAVPSNVSYEEAKSATYGGIRSEYLLGTTYTPSYPLSLSQQSGHWYAVCVVDGWNNEFEPAFYGLSTEYSDQVTLQAPVGGATAAWQQTFAWSAAQNGTYRIQVATDEDCSTVVIDQDNITANAITLDLDTLDSGATYYWRVNTVQPGRLGKWSAVASFKAPVRTNAEQATLVSPANGASFDSDFTFEFTPVTADSYKLQVSKTADFSTVAYETSQFTAKGGNLTAPYSLSQCGSGTLYWRVVTIRKHYNDTPSASRSFVVTKVPTGNFEAGYVVKRDIDASTYADAGGMRLTNLWVRSVMSDYNNITFESNGGLNRGCAVLDGYVYVSGRTAASSSAPCYLGVYSAETGEHVRDIDLSTGCSASYMPCNDVQTDNAGHLVVSNMTLNVSTAPLVLHSVDPATGTVKQVASLRYDDVATRIDHCAVYGDVETGNFVVMAAERYGTNVIRWTMENGQLVDADHTSMTALSPASATDFGIAPQLFAESESMVYVNGSGNYFARYNFDTGTLDSGFATSSPMAPAGKNGNGGTAFALGGKHYMVYPNGDYASAFTFNLVQNDGESGDFAGYNLLWTLPKRGLGNVNSSTWSAQCASAPMADGSQLLVLYVPGNGMAAYRLSSTLLRGDVNGDGMVNVADVSTLVNIVSSGAVADLQVTDLNGDGTIDVSDISTLINILLQD